MEPSDQKYLKSLIAQGEHQELDFKFEISDARKIARTLSAFSNTSGGRLLVGVKDNGRIRGIRSDEEYYMVESAASLYCKPEVQFETRNHSIEGKSVLEIYIPPVDYKPVYALDEEKRWMAYIRVAEPGAGCWSSPGRNRSFSKRLSRLPGLRFQRSSRIPDFAGMNWLSS